MCPHFASIKKWTSKYCYVEICSQTELFLCITETVKYVYGNSSLRNLEMFQEFFEDRIPQIEQLLQAMSNLAPKLEKTNIADHKRNYEALLSAKQHMHKYVSVITDLRVTVLRIITGSLTQLLQASLWVRLGSSPGRSNQMRCRQPLVISMFLGSCVGQALSRGDGPRLSLHASAY